MARWRELHLAMQPGRRRLGQLLLVHDAAGDVLVERTVGVQQAGRRTAVAERFGDVAQHVVVDAVGDLRPERGLVDVGVDVDDQPVLELLGRRRGLGQIVARVGARGNLLELGDPRARFRECSCFPPCVDEPYGGLYRFQLLSLPIVAAAVYWAARARNGCGTGAERRD